MTLTLNHNVCNVILYPQAQNNTFAAIENRFMYIKYIYVYKRNLNPRVK